MFRRIVSNLAFSPALVGQLGFYAKRLRKEESTRRLGLVFTALALIVQSLAVFSPPEAANAATPGQVGSSPRCTVDAVGPRSNAFKVINGKAVVSFDVSGGKTCKVQVSVNAFFAPSMDGHPYEQQILHDRTTKTFDTPGRYTMQADLPNHSTPAKGCFYQADLTYGTHNILPVLAYDHGKLDCGVTPPPVPPVPPVPVPVTPTASCSSVAATITNRTQAYFTGSAAVTGGATIRSYTFVVKNGNGAEIKRITVPSSATSDGTSAVSIPNTGNYSVQLIVQTSLGDRTNSASCVKPFTITPPSVCQYNPTLPPSSPDCQPCENNPDVWIKDEKCAAVIIDTKTATNMTQGNVSASTVTARAGDKLSYTITVQNKGLVGQSVTMQEDLSDVLEYATLVDQGGGELNAQDKTLTWPAVTLAAGQKQSRTLAVEVMSDIPSTNTGTGIPTSYDCKMANTFGNTITVGVDCPTQKVVVEQVTKELPHTGPTENMIFAGALLAVVIYFYARSRQLGTEVRLIRRNLNTGTI
jgi:hypothetical protein